MSPIADLPEPFVTRSRASRTYWCRCLGGLSLHRTPEEQTPLLNAGKPLALLAFVGLAPHGRTDRDHAAELIWPGSDFSEARHSLRQALYRLRQVADEDVLVEAVGNELHLSPTVGFDWQQAEAVANKQPHVAYALLRGNFLEGFSIPESKEFEAWVESQRTRFRELKALVGSTVARRSLAEGDLARALEIADELLAIRPFDAELIHLALSALERLGRHATAVARYHAFARLLKAELDEEAPEELVVFAAELERFLRSHPDRSESALPFVGRAAERASLENAWEEARKGNGGMWLVEGAAGFGKSRLLAELEARVRASNGAVFVGKCYEIERAVPYGVVAEALAWTIAFPELGQLSPSLLAEAARVIPELRERFTGIPTAESAEASAASKRRLHHALSRCLEEVAESRPVYVAIDDLHWADGASLEVLHLLAQRASRFKILLVLTYRPAELSPGARQLARSLIADRLARLQVLGPLTVADVSDLLSRLGRFDSSELLEGTARHLHGHSGGNPLFLTELLESLARTRLLRIEGDKWALAPGARIEEVPKTLSKLMADRMDALEPWMQACVEIMAVVGGAIPVDLLARAVDVSEPRTELALAVLQEERLVQRVGPGTFDLIHDELRRLVYHGILDDRRRVLHAAVGLALETGGEAKLPGGAVRLAHHFGQAEDTARAHRYALIAAREAGALAAEDAAQIHWQVASAHAPKALPPGKTGVRRPPPIRRWVWAGASVLVLSGGALGVRALGWLGAKEPVAPSEDFRLGTIRLALIRGSFGAGAHPASQLTHAVRWSASRNAPGHLDNLPADANAGPELVRRWTSAGGATHGKLYGVRGTDTVQLTVGDGDDSPVTWSPDGRSLLIRRGWKAAADRWQENLFLLDTLGRPVQQLTRTAYQDLSAAWSPSGARIAFKRDSLGIGSLWVMDADGTNLDNLSHRFDLPNLSDRLTMRFSPGDSELALFDSDLGASMATVRILNVRTGAARMIWLPATTQRRFIDGHLAWSPDGRWLALPSVADSNNTRVLWVVRSDGSGEPQLVAFLPGELARLEWTDSRPRHVEVVRLDGTTISLVTGSGVRARAAALAPNGDSLSVPLRWAAQDTAIARVDDGGFVVGKVPGTTKLVASAGGFRSDTVEVTVAFAAVDTVFIEEWSRGLDTTLWQPFGEPEPRVVSGSPLDRGSVLLTNGDYNHTSGIVLRRGIEIRSEGITVEAEAHLRFTGSHWQDWYFSVERPGVRRFGARELVPVESYGDPKGVMLGGPNLTRRQPVWDACGGRGEWPLRDLVWLNNRWHRLAIQLRPDSVVECWMNGRLLATMRTPAGLRPGGLITVWLGGRMENTALYHGRVVITRGLRY